MQSLSKSRKYMVYAFILVFIAQFFDFGTVGYSYITTGGGFSLYNRASYTQDGWHYHSWYSGIVMAFIAYMFYTKELSVKWYWVSAVVCLLLGAGSEFGGLLGLVSIIMGFYSVYLKRKELKAVVPAKTQ